MSQSNPDPKFARFDPITPCSLAFALAGGKDVVHEHPLRRIFDAGKMDLISPTPQTVAALKLKSTSKFNKNLAALILQHGTFEHKDPDKEYLLALADALAKAVTCDLPLPGSGGSAAGALRSP